MTFFWHFYKIFAALLISLSAATSWATDSPLQPLQSIIDAAVNSSQQRASALGYNNVTIETRPLDSRLRLPLCSKPLNTAEPTSGQVLGSISVGVRCQGENPWSIYVRTKVSAMQAVPVLARPLARGDIIAESDLKTVNQLLGAVGKGIILDTRQIVGMQLSRPLDVGSSLRTNQLKKPKVIKRGQQVTLVANMNGLKVKSQGKAMRDAVAGERVIATNLSSGKQVEGTALSDGTVIVR